MLEECVWSLEKVLKEMAYRILRISLVIILFGIWIGGSIVFSKERNPVVYIDPLFGGEETGPILKQQYAGKTFTLDTAKKLNAKLEKKSIVAPLSRDQNSFLPLADRIRGSRMKNADVYIAIGLSKSDRDCINLYYPKRLSTAFEMEKGDVGHILFDVVSKEVIKDSTALARSIRDSLKANAALKCTSAKPRSTYLLDNSLMTTVVVDFRVFESGSAPLYIMDAVTVDRILDAISDGIENNIRKN